MVWVCLAMLFLMVAAALVAAYVAYPNRGRKCLVRPGSATCSSAVSTPSRPSTTSGPAATREHLGVEPADALVG